MSLKKLIIFIVGAIIGTTLTYFYISHEVASSEPNTAKERKPLYWVAPMDSNFRRNEPGLSPMGMDLVPVYENQGSKPGVIRIAPNIVQNLGIKTSAVIRQPLVQTIKSVGKIQYNQNQMLHVHPRVSGWINELHFKSAGLFVNEGDPLFTLYSLELVNAQEEYILALNSNRSQLINGAKSKLMALNLDNNTITRVAKNRKSEQYVTFFAPQNGIISHLKVSEGQFIDPKDEIMSLADLSFVWLNIELAENQMAWVSKGDDVSLKISALPDKIFFGEVDFIYPYLDEVSQTAKVRLTIDNKEQLLKPGMLADVMIKPTQTKPLTLVPRSAVIRLGDGDNRVVWAVNPGEYKSIRVELGQSNDEYFAIQSGIELGDRVVTSAQFLLDSESSKSSDFSRYEIMDENAKIQSARTFGVIKDITDEFITIERAAIEKWNRPAAVVEFVLKDRDKHLKINQKIDFSFEIRSEVFVITEIHQLLTEVNND